MELTREQVLEQLEDIHLGSVEVRLKAMACIKRHDQALRQQLAEMRQSRDEYKAQCEAYHAGMNKQDDYIKELRGQLAQATARVASLEGALKGFVGKPKEMQDVMRKHGLKIDDLDNPMQKLAFTFYTELVEVARDAEHALEGT